MIAPLGVNDRRDLGSRLFDGCAVRQPADDAEIFVPAVGPLLIGEGNRRPQLSAIGCGEARDRNPDDFVRLAVQPHALADDVRVGCESPGPQSVSEHDALVLARLRLAHRKRAAQDRTGAHQLEESRRDKERGHLLGDVDAGQVRIPPLVHRPVLDGRRPFAPLAKVRGGDVDAIEEVGILRRGGGHDETIDAGETVRTEHERVHQAEGDAVGRQGERERDDDRERHQWSLAERAPGVAQIARQSRPAPAVGVVFGDRDPPHRRFAAEQSNKSVSHGNAEALAKMPP